MRQELVVRQLLAHLDTRSRPSVIDIGCGQATVAIALARAGCQVVGVDPSEAMLQLANDRRGGEPEPVKQRLCFIRSDLASLSGLDLGEFDLVCCHGVLMYLPALEPAVEAVVAVARRGGVVSTLTRNRAGIAMRAGMQGDWAGARAGFDATHYQNRVGVQNARADSPQDVTAAFAKSRCEVVAWYGVRLFTDHWDASPVPLDFRELLDAEEEAGRRDPYRQLAALTHVIARRL